MTELDSIAVRVQNALREGEIDDWGVANNAVRFPLSPRLPTALSLVKRLRLETLEGLKEGPTEAYFAEFLRLNWLLNQAGETLVALLEGEGYHAQLVPSIIPDPDAVEDWGRAGVFPHKTAATQAGLGWIGKTALFVHRRYGPKVRLATLFTSAELPFGIPVVSGECGSCFACVKACPVGAGKDVTWTAGMPRDEFFDEKKCEQYTDGFWPIYGGTCGVCVAACPVGRTMT